MKKSNLPDKSSNSHKDIRIERKMDEISENFKKEKKNFFINFFKFYFLFFKIYIQIS